jgi:hypothetical protein
MKKIIASLALFAALASGAASAETVDCFYEFNASHPACQK